MNRWIDRRSEGKKEFDLGGFFLFGMGDRGNGKTS